MDNEAQVGNSKSEEVLQQVIKNDDFLFEFYREETIIRTLRPSSSIKWFLFIPCHQEMPLWVPGEKFRRASKEHSRNFGRTITRGIFSNIARVKNNVAERHHYRWKIRVKSNRMIKSISDGFPQADQAWARFESNHAFWEGFWSN
jgi:hypothetical protein